MFFVCSGRSISFVALRKESVDRNAYGVMPVSLQVIVALRKESVDRNKLQRSIDTMSQPSLSARRAWIEIFQPINALEAISCRSPQGERG